jgi:hypothetical protein
MNQKNIKPIIFAAIIFFGVSLSSCYNDSEEELYGTIPTTNCDLTSPVKFSTIISPIISSKCATSGCHSTSSKAAGINLGTFDAIKAYITKSQAPFLGSIKRDGNYSPMPKGSPKLADCDISKIESWIAAGMPNN